MNARIRRDGILPRPSALFRVRRTPTSRVPRPAVPSPSRAARTLSARVAVRRSSRRAHHLTASSAPPTARFDWRAVVIGTRAHLLSPHSSPSPLSRALILSRSRALSLRSEAEREAMYVCPSLSRSRSRSLSRACVRPTATVERSAFELDRARETAERRAEDRPRW